MASNACIISGLETDNKYKGNFIHKDVIDLAKTLVAEQGGDMLTAFRYISASLAESTLQRLEQGETPYEQHIS